MVYCNGISSREWASTPPEADRLWETDRAGERGWRGAEKKGIGWCCGVELAAAAVAAAATAKAAGLLGCIMVAVCRKEVERDWERERGGEDKTRLVCGGCG